jgi:hypothetical protein
VGAVWPQSEVHYCEYHLKERCYVKLRGLGLATPGTPAYDTVERAFTSIVRFEAMKAAWMAVRTPTLRKKLVSYLRHIEPVVRPQIGRRSSWPNRAHPYGTGALEKHLERLRSQIGYRAGQFTNKQRLDRALLLMMLHLNGLADERDYSERVRSWLLTNGGHPLVRRRAIVDVLGTPSLRA